MSRTYLRPLALSYGRDAARAIGEGRAGRLGGSRFIAYGQAEVITRGAARTSREIASYGDLRRDPVIARIDAARADFAGIDFSRPRIMGIVNVTPDSFSDGGRFAGTDQAVAHGRTLAAEGADILDIGGESTRPGSDPVEWREEAARVLPVIAALAGDGRIVSADTRKPAVMRAAATAGARIVNDVSALTFDANALATVQDLGLPVVLMHAQGDPRTMQLNPKYDDVTLDVFDALEARVKACEAAGIPREKIAVDPGIGFGKTFRHNLELLQQLSLFQGLGTAVLVGLSRKAFIGALTGEKTAGARVFGSVGGAVHAALNGAHIIRLHDVRATVQALAVALAAADPESAEF